MGRDLRRGGVRAGGPAGRDARTRKVWPAPWGLCNPPRDRVAEGLHQSAPGGTSLRWAWPATRRATTHETSHRHRRAALRRRGRQRDGWRRWRRRFDQLPRRGGGGRDDSLLDSHPAIWLPMIDTADILAARCGLSCEHQYEYSLRSHKLMAAAHQAGKFKDEIIPVATRMKAMDKLTQAESGANVGADREECNHPTPHWKAWPGWSP